MNEEQQEQEQQGNAMSEEQREPQEPQGESLDSLVQRQQEEIAALKSELTQMRTVPHVVGSTPGGESTDRRQLGAMSYAQRVKFKRENPKLYSELTD